MCRGGGGGWKTPSSAVPGAKSPVFLGLNSNSQHDTRKRPTSSASQEIIQQLAQLPLLLVKVQCPGGGAALECIIT